MPWSESDLRRAASSLGYWPAKVIGHQNDYWFLVRKRSPTEPIFLGENGDDYIQLGPLNNAEAVYAVINYMKSQDEARKRAEAQDEEGAE